MSDLDREVREPVVVQDLVPVDTRDGIDKIEADAGTIEVESTSTLQDVPKLRGRTRAAVDLIRRVPSGDATRVNPNGSFGPRHSWFRRGMDVNSKAR